MSGRRLIRRRPFSRPLFAVFLGLSGGDGDAAFEDEVDVVADSFRASIIFRLPAPTSMYHSIAMDVNLLFSLRVNDRQIILVQRLFFKRGGDLFAFRSSSSVPPCQ